MAEKSLGNIFPSGGPTRATFNQDDPTKALWAHSYRVQHLPANSQTGHGFVGDKTMSATEVADGYYGILPSKADAPPWPVYESPRIEARQNPFNMADIYFDCDVAGDGFLVTIMQV